MKKINWKSILTLSMACVAIAAHGATLTDKTDSSIHKIKSPPFSLHAFNEATDTDLAEIQGGATPWLTPNQMSML